MSETTAYDHAGCSKRPFSKAAASEETRRTLRYVEPLSDARTPLTDFFSILLDMYDLERSRPLGDLHDVSCHRVYRKPVETVPIGTGLVNTFLASRHIRTQDDSLAERLPTSRKIVTPRIEQTDIRNPAGCGNMGRACGSGDHRMTCRNHGHQLTHR
jgi:hypothetical protein